jgi:hypothetical protein
MSPMDVAALGREISRLHRLHASLLEGAREAPTAWEVDAGALRWHVVLPDVLEPDVDVEVLDEVLVVRALVESLVRVGLCPVPRPFDARAARFEFRGGVLEVRVFRGSS